MPAPQIAQVENLQAELDKATNTILYTCTVTEVVGNPVYISSADTVAQADASVIGTARVVGWIYSKPTDTSCLVSRGPGPVTASGLTVGAPVFLSDTAGAVATAPGTITVEVGVAKTTTSFIFTGARISG